RSLRAPVGQTGEAIRTVADHSEVVRNRLRLHAEFGYNSGFVAQNVTPAIQLDNSGAHNTLTQILVWRTNEHLPHAAIFRCLTGRGSESVIRLVVDHGPNDHSHCI